MTGLERLAASQALPSRDFVNNALITELVIPYFFNGGNPVAGATVTTDPTANSARVVFSSLLLLLV